MNPITWLIYTILDLISFGLYVYVILQLLLYFRVLDTRNEFVRKIVAAFHQLFEPLLGKIRKKIPAYQGFDISPLVLALALSFAKYTIAWIF